MSEHQRQELITAYWSDHAVSYDDHPTSRLHMGDAADVWQRIWASALPDAPLSVLDLGTGTGQVALHLWALGHRVTGTDLAEGMLDLARAKAAALQDPPAFLVGDAAEPDLPEASYDAVTARYLLWTLRHPERSLSRWLRLLRPGGTLAVVDSTWFERGIATGHDRRDDDVFLRAYRDAVADTVTLAESTSIDPFVAAVEGAGFVDVRVRELPELHAAEARLVDDPATADEVDLRMQYLITARRPGGASSA